MTRRRAALSALVLLAAALLAALAIGALPTPSLAALAAHRQALEATVAAYPLRAAALFVALYIGFAALPLPGAEVLSIAAGALFGLWEGVVLVSFSASIGACLAFLASRRWLRGPLRRHFAASAERIAAGAAEDGAFYLFALRLMPIVPFFLVNLLMGFTELRLVTFYWVSQIAMLPATIAYVNAGLRLGQVQSLSDILSLPVLLSFAAIGLLPLASRRLIALLRARRHGGGGR